MLATQSIFLPNFVDWKASGGTETTYGTYKSHRFTANGTLTVTTAGTMDIFMVAGGGGGGFGSYGGAGGAGGARVGAFVMEIGNYTITIGTGGQYGSEGTWGNQNSASGVNSTIVKSGWTGGDSSGTTITANGGGLGGSEDTDPSGGSTVGGPGGSGGGGSSAGSDWEPYTPPAPYSSPYSSVADAYHTGSGDTTWQDITGEGDLDIDIDPDYEKYLWEYDPYKEEAIRAGAYGDIAGQYAGARGKMMKARQPSKAGGSFAGTGSSLLDMTTESIYGDVERGTRGSILDMMTDITGERTGYREDIIDRLMQIQQMRGEEFEDYYEEGGGGGGEDVEYMV